MKNQTVKKADFAEHFSVLTGDEWVAFDSATCKVLMGIKILAAGRRETKPITLRAFSELAEGKLNKNQIFTAALALKDAKKIKTRETPHGTVYTVLENKARTSLVRRVAEFETKYGSEAPDELVQMAVTRARRSIRQARKQTALAREIEMRERAKKLA